MTVSVILKEVENEDLVGFIGEYARKDQQFSNALKTRFATSVNVLSSKEKYGQLLHTLIRSNRSPNRVFTRTGARKIHDMLLLLVEQVEDEFRGENYIEVFEATKSIIEKLTPVLPDFKAHQNDILVVIELCWRLISEMPEEPISPQLRHSIANFFVTGIRQYYFNLKNIDRLFLSILAKISDETEGRKILLECFEAETQKKFRHPDIEAKIFFFALALSLKTGDEEFKEIIINRILERSRLMRNVVDVAVEFNHFKSVIILTEAAFENPSQKKNYFRFDEIRLRHARRVQSKESIAYFSAKRLLSELDFSYYLEFRDQFDPGAEELSALIRQIEKFPGSISKVGLLAEIYAVENEEEKLFDLIEKSGDLGLLKKHGGTLYGFDKKKALNLVWTEMDRYLENHRGRPAAVTTRKFIRELYRNEGEALAKALIRKIKTKHGNRQSLKDELLIFRE